MKNAIRSEWIKFRTVLMNWVLTIIAVGLPLVVVTLTGALRDESGLDASSQFDLVTFTSVLTALLLGVIGATSITGEFAFNTIRPTFAATPKRGRVIISKAIVTGLVAAIVEAVVIAVCIGLSVAIGTARDVDIDFGSLPNFWPPVIGLVLFATIVSLLGFGVGLIVRSTPAAVSVLILWVLIVESLIALILSAAGVDNARKWMPYAAGINLGNPDIDSESLGRLAGGLYFGGFTLVVVLIGSIITQRRDA